MAASSAVMKDVVRTCCNTIAYDPDDNTFVVTLLPQLYARWQRMSKIITLDDFNAILAHIQHFSDDYISLPMSTIADSEMVNGEVLALTIEGEKRAFVKMEQGQYLDSSTGRGIVVGDRYCFAIGKILVDDKGQEVGQYTTITLRTPTLLQRLVSIHLMQGYYRHQIATSLWVHYDEAREIVRAGRGASCDALLSRAAQKGISLFTLFYILTAATRWRQ